MNVKGLLIVNLLLAAAMAGFALWIAANLESGAQLPIHWNAAGEVDGYAPALLALIFPAGASLLLSLIFASLTFLEPLQDRLEASAGVARVAWIGTMLLMATIQLMIAASAFGWSPSADVLPLGVGALLLAIGNSLPKSRPGFFVGIRTPWTLVDTDNWIATHRLGGKLMMSAGGLTMLATYIPMSSNLKSVAIVVAIGASALIPIAYSWWFWRRKIQAAQSGN
jgi:uncharacterized membrane protein